MNGTIFENWFQSTLLPNLSKGKKVVIDLDNTKHHSRYVERTPTMNMKKNDMIAIMINYGIEIPDPLSTKTCSVAENKASEYFQTVRY